MTLIPRLLGRDHKASSRRRPMTFRPGIQPTLENLEARQVLTTVAIAPLAQAATAPATLTSSVTSFTVNSVQYLGGNNFLARANLTGTLLSQPFTLHNVQIPFTVTQTGTTPPTATDPQGCPILHLSLEIPDLNILGLHVQLNNCSNGPVTVDITAVPTGATGPGGQAGGLLGDLLCSLDNLLNQGGGLLGGLTSAQVSQVNGALQQVFNGVLGSVTGSSTAAPPTSPGQSGTCQLVNLHLEPLTLDVLGLVVQTSPICLNIYAQQNGGLLGSLLCSIDNLLSNGLPVPGILLTRLDNALATL